MPEDAAAATRSEVAAPHALTAAEVGAALGTDLRSGLTEDEPAVRLRHFGTNEIRAAAPPSFWSRLLRQFQDPLVYLLLGAIAVSFTAWLIDGTDAVPLDALVIGGIVIANASIGFLQERKADEAVNELRTLITTSATVIRGGRRHSVSVATVVPGDLLLLHEGDVVPADGRIVQAEGLSIAEAVLTGESQPADKSIDPVDVHAPLGDRTDMAFGASSVVTGSGRMVVTATGMHTELGEIASMLAATEEPPTPLEREVGRISRVLGVAVVVVSIIVMTAIGVSSGVDTATEAIDLLLIGVSLAVAAVPEGLPAVLSLVLAVGVRRMAARNALVKRLAYAETLGSTTVICTDKTGTLTRNEMVVRRVVGPTANFDLTGTGYSPTGEVNSDAGDGTELRAALEAAVLASDADVRLEAGTWRATGAPTEAALVTAALKVGIDATALRHDSRRVGEIPFDSSRKRMTTLHDYAGNHVLISKGAPEVVLPLCSSQGHLDVGSPMSDVDRDRWRSSTDALAARGLRTLAVAARIVSDPATAPSVEASPANLGELEHGLVLLGVFGIVDPPRTGVAEAVAAAQAAGIAVVMVTGDHPLTAIHTAREIGIAGSDRPAITGSDIDGAAGIEAFATSASVFSRVAPRHKVELVEALQRAGHVVAMTGDGVNDAPALRAADIGIAMGIAGSDVSKGAAAMVLADDNFATIVASVEEGRSIFANIASFLRYLLSSNVGEVLTMLVGVLFASLLGLEGLGDGEVIAPLVATQILWINLLTDTGPALALGLEPVDPDLMRRRPRRPGAAMIDCEMLTTVIVVGFTMALATLAMFDAKLPGGLIEGTADVDTARTCAFTVLVLAQLLNAFATRTPDRSVVHRLFANPWLFATVGVSLGLQVLVVHLAVLNQAFSTTPLSLRDWLLCTLFASSVIVAGEVLAWTGARRRIVGRR